MMSEKEILVELLKIAKADNKKFTSMKNNLQFLAWVSIISIVLGVIAVITVSSQIP